MGEGDFALGALITQPGQKQGVCLLEAGGQESGGEGGGEGTKMKPRDTLNQTVHYGLGDLGHVASSCWASVSLIVKWGSTSSSLRGLLRDNRRENRCEGISAAQDIQKM